MKLKLCVSILAIGMLAAGQAVAHHSFAATYFEEKTVQIEGKLVQFQFRNPHSFIQVEVKDDKGQIQRWSVEWGGASQLGAQGVTSETLKYGDIVTLSGAPGRDEGDNRMLLRSLRRKSDNFGWGQRPGEVVQ
jgi:lysyl-tRNA synthetase class II